MNRCDTVAYCKFIGNAGKGKVTVLQPTEIKQEGDSVRKFIKELKRLLRQIKINIK